MPDDRLVPQRFRDVTFIRKDDSRFIWWLSWFFWIFGRRERWLRRYWVAGLPFTGRTIYVPRKAYEGMGEVWWFYTWIVSLDHEMEHLDQRNTTGDLRYLALYILSPWHRADWELKAYRINVMARKDEAGRASKITSTVNKLRKVYFVWPWPTRKQMTRKLRKLAGMGPIRL